MSVQKAKSNKMENASTHQIVNQVSDGTVLNANKYHVIQVLHTIIHVDVVKLQLTNALLVLIGMVSDVSTLLTYVQLV